MGIVPLPEWHMFWSTDSHFQNLTFKEVMSRDRFFKISQHLHISDNDDKSTVSDKLGKIRPMITALQKSFRTSWNPSYNISIDEGVIKCQNRTSLKQRMPDKPEKYGLKIYKLCDEHGYLVNFEIYDGLTKKTDNEDDEEKIEDTYTAGVVKKLLQHIKGAHPHHLFADNWYTTIKLVADLKRQNIYYTGTLRSDAKFIPKDLRSAELTGRYKWEFRTGSPQLLLIKWKDTKVLYLISSAHIADTKKVLRRQKGQVARQETEIPTAAADYNDHMGSVDTTTKCAPTTIILADFIDGGNQYSII